jgi:hypothetical protein
MADTIVDFVVKEAPKIAGANGEPAYFNKTEGKVVPLQLHQHV